jgi:hypothetical protein
MKPPEELMMMAAKVMGTGDLELVEKIVVLRTAYATLEAMQQQDQQAKILAANLQNLFSSGSRQGQPH